MPVYADVILPLAIQDTYTYRVPDEWASAAVTGARVVVPLGKKEVSGIVYRRRDDLPSSVEAEKVRELTAVLDTAPAVTEEQLRLWQWMSDYYLCPIGDVLAAALPNKTLDRQFSFDAPSRRTKRAHTPATETHPPYPLTSQQARCTDEIRQQWQEKQVVLLHGVTSSGKTEVYIHLIEEQLQEGRQVLYLVPEIALTAQLTDRLERVFGGRMSVYHSRVSDTKRAEVYKQVLNHGPGRLVVGARSAVFLPFRNLGLVIVDEEHEASYKQQDPAPRYHARSVAIMLATQTGARVLLGTATPAIETQRNAETGKYGISRMTERFAGLQMPRITLIDLNRQYHRKEMYGHLSDPLVERIREELGKGKQVILFQNRRGYAPYMQCTQCGSVPKCPDCDVALTVHRNLRGSYMQCHYCGYESALLSACPECGGEVRVRGFGTERLEDEVAQLFPEAKTARMDLDSTRKKDAYQEIIRSFSQHEVDILIGTQMVTKGLHFDDVSLVAVLQADSLFNQPSFRSYERAFQMLEQVAGRAGRKGQQGEVIIQTFDPKHPIFDYLGRHDTDDFYRWQIQEREQFRFPPFVHLITLTLKHRDERRTEEAAEALRQRLTAAFGNRCSAVMQPSVTRIQSLHLRQLQLRIERNAPLGKAKQMVREILRQLSSTPPCKGVIIQPDTDPM
ncbi:MAG: primosomal protein N' [Paludibacteraceae bacterium]|nr:primosomal protein N' [Paludibacteraceae bacterium]